MELHLPTDGLAEVLIKNIITLATLLHPMWNNKDYSTLITLSLLSIHIVKKIILLFYMEHAQNTTNNLKTGKHSQIFTSDATFKYYI